jgi:hypothetical protein
MGLRRIRMMIFLLFREMRIRDRQVLLEINKINLPNNLKINMYILYLSIVKK